jgi:glycogen synthase
MLGLYSRGVDLHVGQPDYRQVFSDASRGTIRKGTKKIPAALVHLTEDRAFYYSRYPDSNAPWQNITISIAFQREVIHQVIPMVQPDLIHCHDWMTGLIPSMVKAWEIPCLFTFNSRHSAKCRLACIEDMGIDAHAFWRQLFYQDFPTSYERTRDNNPVDFLLSGILAAEHVNTPTFPSRAYDIDTGEKGDKTVLNNLMAEKYKSRSASTFYHQDFCEACIRIYEKILERPVSLFKKSNHNMHHCWTPGSSVSREQMQPDA